MMPTIIEEGRLCLARLNYYRSLPDGKEILKKIYQQLSKVDLLKVYYDWNLWARPEQLPPEDLNWRYWLLLAGRGFGKTRTGAEWIKDLVARRKASRIALIAPTAADVRDVMIEGESGLIEISHPQMRPVYQPSKRKLVWPNGAMAFAYSADEPDRLRGPQHDAIWADELATWRYPGSWDNANLGLRLGDNPRAVITTTPRPVQFLKDLLKNPHTYVTRGSTFDNQKNLPRGFIEDIVSRYQGTPLGAQEINAQILDEIPGVMWNQSQLDELRVDKGPLEFDKVVVALDPAVTSGTKSDETGIIVVGKKGHKGYVIDDLSGQHPPEIWANHARDAYYKYKARCIVAESNQGGDLIKSVLRVCAPELKIFTVRAIKGKAARAEPIAALYAKGDIHHIGEFKKLEDQMCTCDLTDKRFSPDRLDALVWGFTELFLTKRLNPVSISVIKHNETVNI